MYEVDTFHISLWGRSVLLFCGYLLSTWIIYKNKRKDLKAFQMVLPLVWIGLLLLYFPGFEETVKPYIGDSYKVFRRFRWILLLVPVMSIAMAQVLSEIDEKRQRIVLVICLIAMMVLWQPSWIMTTRVDHYYKIPKECVEIADYIESQYAEEFEKDRFQYVTICVQDDDETAGSGEDGNRRIGWGVRQYLSPVVIEFATIRPENADSISGLTEAEYIICSKTEEIRLGFEAEGYVLVHDYDGFCFYEKP